MLAVRSALLLSSLSAAGAAGLEYIARMSFLPADELLAGLQVVMLEAGSSAIEARTAQGDRLTKVGDVGMTISVPPQPCAAPSVVASRQAALMAEMERFGISAEDEVEFAALMAERDELRAAEAAWQAVSKQARKKKTRR